LLFLLLPLHLCVDVPVPSRRSRAFPTVPRISVYLHPPTEAYSRIKRCAANNNDAHHAAPQESVFVLCTSKASKLSRFVQVIRVLGGPSTVYAMHIRIMLSHQWSSHLWGWDELSSCCSKARTRQHLIATSTPTQLHPCVNALHLSCKIP
jgi:hypothetical protein